jgi:hypothetical protein
MQGWIDLSIVSARKFYKTKVIALILLFSITHVGRSQTREYAIKVIGIKVGSITAEKHVIGENIAYLLKSDVSVNFLVYKLVVDYSVKSLISTMGLLNSEVKVISNRGNYTTLTKKSGEDYKVQSIQKGKTILKEVAKPINNTFASLFFNEPSANENVYAEFYADFIQISKKSKGKYIGELDKNIDEYHYENGELIKIIKKNPITDLVIEYQAPINKITH